MKFFYFFLSLVFFSAASTSAEACRKISFMPGVVIRDDALAVLQTLGITKEKLFELLKEISQTESRGCWSNATGDFDDQLISVGALQWNFGQASLQKLLVKFQKRVSETRLDELVRNHKSIIFSKACLEDVKINDGHPCHTALKKLQNNNGVLSDTLRDDFNKLFESDEMIQVQVEEFAIALTSVRDDLKRIFPAGKYSPVQIHWAMDLKVQQGDFPLDRDIARVRELAVSNSSQQQRAEVLIGIVKWYHATAWATDQSGTRKDRECNVYLWTQYIRSAQFTAEQYELLLLTFLRSRTASGESGRWQALTFQRRAVIALNLGSVAGRMKPREVKCTKSDAEKLLFSAAPLEPLQQAVKLDRVIHRGHLPNFEDIERIHGNWDKLDTDAKKRDTLLSVVRWYYGVSSALDQNGAEKDKNCNVIHWAKAIRAGVKPRQAEGILTAYMGSRLYDIEGGRWQAAAFQRAMLNILNIGSIDGVRTKIPPEDTCDLKSAEKTLF